MKSQEGGSASIGCLYIGRSTVVMFIFVLFRYWCFGILQQLDIEFEFELELEIYWFFVVDIDWIDTNLGTVPPLCCISCHSVVSRTDSKALSANSCGNTFNIK